MKKSEGCTFDFMTYTTSEGRRAVSTWLLIGMVMVFVMVAIGGLTRLTESGLSITTWDPIMGAIPPMQAEDWVEVFDKYKATPEYKHKNSGMRLSEFQYIFWWEWIHRQWGRLIGLVFIIPFFYFLKKKYLRKKGVSRLLVILGLGALQAFLGWYMVASGLVEEPRVSHYRLAAHLCTAFLTISLTWWLWMDIRYDTKIPPVNAHPGFRSKVLVFLVLLSFQIVYGAFTAGKDAGHASAHWPQWTSNSWMPMTSGFELSALWNDPAWIQFSHRWFAVLVVGYLLYLALSSRKLTFSRRQTEGLRYMLGFVALQFVLGVLTLLTEVQVAVALFHQLGALMLLMASLYFWHRLRAA